MVQKITGTWATNSIISFFPSNTPSVINGGFTLSPSATMRVGSNGWASNNLVVGNYRFNIDQSTRDQGVIFVPDSTATFNLWSLLTSSNVLFNSNIVSFVAVAQGSNIVLVTNGNVVTIHSTATGSGGSSTGGVAVAQGTNAIIITNGSVVTINGVVSRVEMDNAIAMNSAQVTGLNSLTNSVSALTNFINAETARASSAETGLSNRDTSISAGMNSLTNSVTALTNLAYSLAGESNYVGEVSITNAMRFGLVNGKVGVTNLLRSIAPGNGLTFTNEGTNLMVALTIDPITMSNTLRSFSLTIGFNATNNDVAQGVLISNRMGTIGSDLTNYSNTKQVGSVALTNAAGNPNLVTNIVAGTGTTVVTSNNVGMFIISDTAQPAAAVLTNAQTSLLNLTNLANTKQFGTATLTNLSGTGALTNGTTITNYVNTFQGGSAVLTNISGLSQAFTNPIATMLTNSIWVSAGAMAPTGGNTAEGGRNGSTAGSYTNITGVSDTWDFDDTTNECVAYTFQPGRGFAGDLSASLFWITTNTLNGASNVVFEMGVSVLQSNNFFGTFGYVTNGTFRFWSSNSVQESKLPLIQVTGQNVDTLLMLRLSRLGTNASDAAIGDARLLGARITFTHTNLIGGYP